jgi:hypothetical protein
MNICINETMDKKYYIMIEINNKQYIDDIEIIKLLDISCEEYQQFLLKNNAYYSINKELIFKTKRDCYDCLKKLKEKYNDRLVMIKLIGG